MVKKLSSVDSNDPMSRTDLARPDRSGRLYGGTFSSTFCTTPRNKTFYRYTSDKGSVRLFTDIYTTSGVAFNEDAQKLYHVDVCLLLITEFDWDPATGDLCNFLMLQLTLNLWSQTCWVISGNGRVAFDFNSIGKSVDSFNPLGAELDNNGLVYTADYRNSIYVINPW